MKLELRKFDITKLRDDSVVLYIGPRNSGKSTNLFDTMRYHTSIPIGVTISGTEGANHSFERVMPKMLIYEEYDSSIVEKFLDRQKKIMDQVNAEKKKYGRSDLDPRAFLILDDCMYDNSWTQEKSIRYIFLNGRHLKIFCLLTMQYCMGIPPALRANVDYIFINRNNMVKEREKIYHQYAGMFPSFDVFNTVMNQTTENYECLVIDKKSQSNRLEDQVFWYKADQSVNYRLCSRELWNIQEAHDEKEALGLNQPADDEEDYNPMIVKKKNAPVIRVKKAQY
jgi:hypothetical protein